MRHRVAGTAEVLQPLRYADDDAVRYYQLFSRLAETHLLVVLDTQTQRRYPGMAAYAQPPTSTTCDDVVAELRAKMLRDLERGDRPVLYFAFSGHGARERIAANRSSPARRRTDPEVRSTRTCSGACRRRSVT